MPAAVTPAAPVAKVAEEATTYNTWRELGEDITATMRHEILARNTVKAHVRRHRARMQDMAGTVAYDYAMFERENPGRNLAPLDADYAFRVISRRHGRPYAIAMQSSMEIAHLAKRMLPGTHRNIDQFS